MLSKVKNFIKYTSLAYTYLFFFILIQSLTLVGVFTFEIFYNIEFQDKFMELLGPIYAQENYLAEYDVLMENYMNLFSDLITPTLFISNLILVIFLGIKLLKENKKVNLIKNISKKDLFYFIGIGITLNTIISCIISMLPTSLIESHSASVNLALTGNPLILIISSGILAPLSEELIFRYGMSKNLSKINPIFSIIFQALLFGIVHANLVQGTYAFILGLIFGIINYKKGNILYSIILHIAINTSSVLIFAIGCNEILGLFLFAIISFLLYLFFKIKDK